jgi:hypothetical protein
MIKKHQKLVFVVIFWCFGDVGARPGRLQFKTVFALFASMHSDGAVLKKQQKCNQMAFFVCL